MTSHDQMDALERATVDDGARTGLLDRLFERLYQRTRQHYFEALLVINTIWFCLVVAPVNVVANRLFFELNTNQALRLLAAFEIAIVLATPGLFLLVLRRHAPAIRWLRGEPGADPSEAWTSAVIDLAGTVFRGAVWYCAWVFPAVIYVRSYIDFSAVTILAWCGAAAVWVAGAALFDYLLFERALRPPLQKLSAALPPDFEPPGGGLSLRNKLLAILLLLSMFSGSFVVSVTMNSANSLSPAGQMGVLLGVTVAFTVTLALALSLLVRESVLTRIETLRRAMGRVARGEYDAHVPPLGGDELDELGRSFNEMVNRLGRHDEELRESRARIVAASDAGRRQVERDLHDGAQQQLVTLRLRIGMARQAVAADPRAAALLDEARDDLSRALEELRDLAHGIYPAVLTTDGLPAALEAAAERCPLPVTVELDGGAGRLAPDVEAAVYFCCVEALQNAAKHAGPNAKVAIHLGSDPSGFRFEVRDNGVGYDPAALGLSAGMQNMADRIGALGGTLRVESAPGAGTSVVGFMLHDEIQGAPR
jgi:signal transduction histidine kinase